MSKSTLSDAPLVKPKTKTCKIVLPYGLDKQKTALHFTVESGARSEKYSYAADFLARFSLNNPHEKRWNPHMLTAYDLNNVPAGSPVQPLVEQAAPVEVQSLDLSKAAAEHAAILLEPEAL